MPSMELLRHATNGRTMQKIMRLKDVAQRLECTPATVHNMLNSGRFPVAPIPGTKPRRWRAEDIEAWLSGSVAAHRASAAE